MLAEDIINTDVQWDNMETLKDSQLKSNDVDLDL